jgi:hypothetical protein
MLHSDAETEVACVSAQILEVLQHLQAAPGGVRLDRSKSDGGGQSHLIVRLIQHDLPRLTRRRTAHNVANRHSGRLPELQTSI